MGGITRYHRRPPRFLLFRQRVHTRSGRARTRLPVAGPQPLLLARKTRSAGYEEGKRTSRCGFRGSRRYVNVNRPAFNFFYFSAKKKGNRSVRGRRTEGDEAKERARGGPFRNFLVLVIFSVGPVSRWTADGA